MRALQDLFQAPVLHPRQSAAAWASSNGRSSLQRSESAKCHRQSSRQRRRACDSQLARAFKEVGHASSLKERHLLQQIQLTLAPARILSGAMVRCDFEVIDDDQDKPTENHMYMLQTLTVPELTRMVTGATSSEAVADLLAEAARICEGVYHEDGIQARCVAVWLHAAKLKPLVMKRLGPPVVFATARATGHTSDGGSAGEELSA